EDAGGLEVSESRANRPRLARYLQSNPAFFLASSLIICSGRAVTPLPALRDRQPPRGRSQAHDCLVETLRTLSAGTATAPSWPLKRTAINSSLSSSVL